MKTLKSYNVFWLLSLFLALFIKGGDMKSFALSNSFPEEIFGELAIENNESNTTSIKVNFGNVSSNAEWNNVTRFGGEVNLKDLTGEDTGIKISIDKIFSGDNTEGVENTNTVLEMPTDVAKSAIWGYARGDFGGHTVTQSSSLVLSDLDRALVYDFYIFGSRKNVNDNRETKYAAKGYNLKSIRLDTANNGSEIALITGIRPSANGQISLTISVGENNNNDFHFYYLNALQLVAREYVDGDFDDNEEEEGENNIEPGAPININFGSTSSDATWNNLTRSSNEVRLIDLDGEDTGINIWIDKTFSGDNTEGVENTNTALEMPADVAKSALWGYAKGDFGGNVVTKSSSVVFSRLNKNLVYDFSIFGSRRNVNDNREAKYVAKGDNLKSRYLDTANNSDEIVLIKGIQPNEDGEITLIISAGFNNNNEYLFYYLNALQLVAREYEEGDFDDNEEEEPDGAIRILAIGNSFSEDAIEQNLYQLAEQIGVDLIIGNAYRGGQGLDSHWNVVTNSKAEFEYRKVVDGNKTNTHGKTLLDCLLDEKWDYITFQQVSQDSGLPDTYEPWLGYLLDYVKQHSLNPDVKFAIHRTWAYAKTSDHGGFNNYGRNQNTMFESIVKAVNNVIKKYEGTIDIIIPAGTAVQNVRSSFIGDALCRDGYHLNDLGRYTAACTWFEVITGESVVDNPYRPSSISEIEAVIAQNAAHYAMISPDVITSMRTFGYVGENVIEPTAPIKVNFGGNSSDSDWNDITLANKGKIGLTDADGNDTEFIIRINKDFSGANTEGEATTNTTLDMPSDVSRSALWGYAQGNFSGHTLTNSSRVVLSHLNRKLVYDFYIFGSRSSANDNREAKYVAHGHNLKTTHLDGAKNTDNITVIKGVKPNTDGEIKLNVSAGENNNNEYKFYYLNALQIVAREYEDGDFDDDEAEPTLDIDEDKKYYIYHPASGLYLCMQTDKKEGEEIGLRRNRLDKNNPTPFEFSFTQAEEGKSIYNISINDKYINAGEDGICMLGNATDEQNGYIGLVLQEDMLTFKMRGLWKGAPNYMIFFDNSFSAELYAEGDEEEGVVWSLQEAASPVNIISVEDREKVKVYPSYSQGEVTIETLEKATVRVMDFAGRILETHPVDGKLTLQLDYENGIYFIAIDMGTVMTHKVILNK